MEYAEKDNLYNQIQKQKLKNVGFDEEIILDLFIQILLSIKEIHKNNIIHRDIKTKNIFLSSNGEIKIGDFGVAINLKNKNDYIYEAVGTL